MPIIQIHVDKTSIGKYIDSICDLMASEPRRIQNVDEVEFTDSETGVRIRVISEDKFLINIPGSKSFVLDKDQRAQLSKAVSTRENVLLLEIHQEMYEGTNEYKLFKEIQKLRKEKQMVEEAYQNLLTVYALNMDGDNDVS